MPNHHALDLVLDGLMRRYTERVPDVQKVLDVMVSEGIIRSAGDVENDHIAFRSLGIPHLGIASLEKVFLALGYIKRDYYYFSEKKLDAYWYAPPAERYPRIFLSQLRVQDLSAGAQAIIGKYTREIHSDPVDALDLSDGAALDAFLPDRWTARRPEVIINPSARATNRPPRPNVNVVLNSGTTVRLTRPPNQGQVGKIINLPKTPFLLENGLRVPCAQVELITGEKVTVPLANLEVFGR